MQCARKTCQHISLASHTSLRRARLVAHVVLAPQVEFGLLEGVQQKKHQVDKTSGSLYCVQRDCATYFHSKKIM